MTRKRVTAAVVAAALIGGGIAGTIFVPSLVGAQDDATTTTEAPTTTDAPTTTEADDDDETTTTTAPEADDDPADDEVRKAGKGQWVADALAPLVENGTLTQEQADAVIKALQDARPDGPGRGHGRGHHHIGVSLETAASSIGITVEELVTAMRDGASIAEVATSKGVDPAKVIFDLVAEVKTRLDEEVAEGDLTQEEADNRLERATEEITDFVNRDRPVGYGFRGGPD
ncbi:MAG TPA: hypothetical protein VJM33_05940, partial [Microthrixaceae bacterium]|nr:hypothetical protein [Microthrixaceae bacterium]